MSNGDRAFRPDVEGLRGLAVLLVVLFHAGFGAPGGFTGVDIFFVISGFLISGLLLRELESTGRIDLSAFYARRIRRLLPAAATVLVVTLIAAWILIDPLDRETVELDGASAALSIANIRFAIAAGDYFSAVANPSPFLHFWSLAVEEQFYLVWPTLLLVGAWMVRRVAGRRIGAAAVLGAVFVASLTADIVVTANAVNVAFYSLPTRAFELAAGGLIAVATPLLARLPRRLPDVLGLAGIAAMIAASQVLDQSLAYPGAYALLPMAGAGAAIAAGPASVGGRVLAVRPLRFLGRISYSVYLWHWPILVLAPIAVGAALLPWQTAACVAVSLLAGALSWRFIEEPFRRGFRPATTRTRRTLLAGLAAVMTLAVASGSLAAESARTLVADTQGPDPTTAAQPIGTLPPAIAWIPPRVTTPPLPIATATPLPTPTDGPTPTPLPSALINHGKLPKDVQPSLAAARNDKEQLWVDGCLGFESATSPSSKCTFGDPSASFTIALVGDSHASDLFPALNAVAKGVGARLVPLVKVACPFIDMRIVDPILKREYTECATWNRAVIARLASLRPDLTIVAMSHWIYPVRSADNNVTAIGTAIGRMLGRLEGQVLLMVDTPHSSYDVPACLSSHLGNIDACATPRRLALSGHGAIERVAATAADVPTLDLAPAICPADPCPAVIDDMIVFRDSHHLTATFAAALAPVVARGLAPYLP
jgi:peptidoglycan/LPS O-acetylase OafA/YrhL